MINEAKGKALILTRYDKIEKIEEPIQKLPEVQQGKRKEICKHFSERGK